MFLHLAYFVSLAPTNAAEIACPSIFEQSAIIESHLWVENTFLRSEPRTANLRRRVEGMLSPTLPRFGGRGLLLGSRANTNPDFLRKNRPDVKGHHLEVFRQSLEVENRAAQILVENGFTVEQNPNPKDRVYEDIRLKSGVGKERRPDYLVYSRGVKENAQVFDHLWSSGSLSQVVEGIFSKTRDDVYNRRQTNRVVVTLSSNFHFLKGEFSLADLRLSLRERGLQENLEEVLVVYEDGAGENFVERVFP